MKRFLVVAITIGITPMASGQNAIARSFFQGAWTGQAQAVKTAIASGQIDIDMATRDGTTALIAATSRGHGDVVEVLIEGGADVNLANEEGETALLIAAMYAMNPIATDLIEAGADVNAVDALGRSPWTWASWGENGRAGVLVEELRGRCLR